MRKWQEELRMGNMGLMGYMFFGEMLNAEMAGLPLRPRRHLLFVKSK